MSPFLFQMLVAGYPSGTPQPGPTLAVVGQPVMIIGFFVVGGVLLAAIAAVVLVILGKAAIAKAAADDVPKTVDALLKGAEVFTKFLPTNLPSRNRGALQDPQASPASVEPAGSEASGATPQGWEPGLESEPMP